MAVVVGGEIRDADLVVGPFARITQRRPRRLDAVAGERFGALPVLRRIVGQADEREWIDDGISGGDAGGQAVCQLVRALPVTDRQCRVDESAQRMRMVRPDRDRPVVARDRFGMPLELRQHIAAGKQCFGIARPQRQSLVEGGERFGVALELPERAAAIVVRLGIVRPQRQRAVVARQGIGVPAQALQRVAAVVVGFDIARVQRQRTVEAVERVLVASKPLQDMTARIVSVGQIGICGRDPVERGQRLVQPSELGQDQPVVRERAGRGRV